MTFISVVRKLSSPNCVRTGTFEHHPTDNDDTKHALETVIASGKSNINNTRKSVFELNMDDTTNQFSSSLDIINTNYSHSNTSPPMTIRTVRSSIFRLLIHMGTLASHFVIENRTNYHTNDENDNNDNAIGTILGQMIVLLMDVSFGLSINLHDACMKKIQLNQRKYPVDLCKGKSGKYTEYSNQTGITKTIGQSTIDINVTQQQSTVNDTDTLNDSCWTETFVTQSMIDIQQRTRQFAIDRDWLQYHTPRNLALALMGEIGELAEIFQFMGDDNDDNGNDKNCDSLNVKQLDKIAQELADVTIYICRLLDVCQISIPQTSSETKDDK